MAETTEQNKGRRRVDRNFDCNTIPIGKRPNMLKKFSITKLNYVSLWQRICPLTNIKIAPRKTNIKLVLQRTEAIYFPTVL